MQIQRILVIGAGTMGRQIAMSAALVGYNTTLNDISGEALTAAGRELDKWAAGRVAKGKLTQADADAALARLERSTDLDAAAGNADLVIEAAVEKLEVKKALFEQLGRSTPAHAILATNSSTLASSHVAQASGRRTWCATCTSSTRPWS
nr:3-hydroxyacyl-CoA dehydrogenase NAD-binding domain-containing protein [Arthrobacter sp. JCM 19049]